MVKALGVPLGAAAAIRSTLYNVCAFITCNSGARDLDPKNQKLFYNDIINYVLYIFIRARGIPLVYT